MKSESAIRGRLQRLVGRYRLRHIKESQRRLHLNCSYNIGHESKKLPYTVTEAETELDLAPRKLSTLVVIQDRDASIRLCSYGIENPSAWNGFICDKDETAGSCGWFRPRVTADQASMSFDNLMSDDAKVAEEYSDVAALQWALNDRKAARRSSFWQRIKEWWLVRRLTKSPEPPQLPSRGDADRALGEFLWKDDSFQDP